MKTGISEASKRVSIFSFATSSTGRMLRHGGAPIWTALTVKIVQITGISVPTGKVGPGPIRTLRGHPVYGRKTFSGKKRPVKRTTFGEKETIRSREDGVGGENWETRRGRSRAGLLRSPRYLHLDLATFGALLSLRIFAPLLALLGTALATLGCIPPKEPYNANLRKTHHWSTPYRCLESSHATFPSREATFSTSKLPGK